MPQNEHVVVIGGAGFIGKRLTAQLLQQGSTVTAVSRSAGKRRSTDDRLIYASCDVSDATGLRGLLRGAQVVYDLSMGGGVTWADYEREVIGGAINVARAAQENGLRRVIYTSSISAVFLGGSGTLNESGGSDPQFMKRGFYGRGKIMAERSLLELHQKEKLPVVIFRPGVVLGPGGNLVHGAFGDDTASDTCVLSWGSGTSPLPCVLVEDVASAMLSGKDATGIEGMSFNLAGDVRPTAAEYMEEIRRRTHRDFKLCHRSIQMIQAKDVLLWSIKRLAGKEAAWPLYRDLQSMTMSKQLDCSLAKQKLGWKPEANREEFFRQALDVHVRSTLPGDVRLETVPLPG